MGIETERTEDRKVHDKITEIQAQAVISFTFTPKVLLQPRPETTKMKSVWVEKGICDFSRKREKSKGVINQDLRPKSKRFQGEARKLEITSFIAVESEGVKTPSNYSAGLKMSAILRSVGLI